MEVYGEAVLTKFAKRHPAARAPLQRFLVIARSALWPHFPAIKRTFPAIDLGKRTGKLIFDIGGNKYRLIASVDFTEQALLIENVWSHEEYNRENL